MSNKIRFIKATDAIPKKYIIGIFMIPTRPEYLKHFENDEAYKWLERINKKYNLGLKPEHLLMIKLLGMDNKEAMLIYAIYLHRILKLKKDISLERLMSKQAIPFIEDLRKYYDEYLSKIKKYNRMLETELHIPVEE